MAIIQTQCTGFKVNLLNGLEDFSVPTPYVYKIALYTANADLNADTLIYTNNGEVTGTGYISGGQVLIPVAPASSGSTAYISFGNVTWTPANFTCRGALIYNSTTGAAVAVLNFGADKTPINTFTVSFPAPTPTTAVIRIS